MGVGVVDATERRATIAYVASDEASHMNGADIRVDGATLS